MAIQSFFRPRKPTSFNHRYIYHDPAKEARERRYERLRNELIDEGEIEGEKTHKYEGYAEGEEYSSSRRVRGKFASGTQHLQKQIDSGLTAHDRRIKMIRLMVMLLAFGFMVWYFFFRY